jgi:hypothetical protein
MTSNLGVAVGSSSAPIRSRHKYNVKIKVTLFWKATSRGLVHSDNSEKPAASIFKE